MRRRSIWWSMSRSIFSRLSLIPVLLAGIAIQVAAGMAAPRQVPEQVSEDGTQDQQAALGTREFTIRHRSVDEVYLLVSPFLGPRGSIKAAPHRRTLSVVDTRATLLRIAGVIETYDVPPRNVEVSVQLILASIGQGAPAPAPPPIRGVIERLSALSTRWKDYRLVGDARILGTEGESSAVQVGDGYRVAFHVDRVSEESRIIRFKPFELQRRNLEVEGMERYSSILRTVLNLRDSQLFIVGASKMERSNRALFMTVTAALQPVHP